MLKLRQSVAPSGGARAPVNERLGVAWIQGELSVVVSGVDESEGLWVSPNPVPDPESLGRALREAVLRTGFKGRAVSLVMTHPRMIQRRIEMPRMRGGTRERFLQRQAEHSPGSDGPIHWICRAAVAASAPEAVIMHLLARRLHDDLVAACAAVGLDLRLLVPLGELLLSAVPSGELSRDDHALMVACLPRGLEVVALRGDGVPLLGRTIGDGRLEDANRVTGDLHRTLQFIEQSFARPVHTIWWLGSSAPGSTGTAPSPLLAQARVIPGDFGSAQWARMVAALPTGHPGNLLTRDQHEAKGRRALRSVHGMLSIVSVLLAVAFCLFAENVQRREKTVLSRLRLERTRLESRERDLEPQIASIRGQRALLQAAGNGPPPVPLWFIGYVARMSPTYLRLTNVSVQICEGGWRYRLGGHFRSSSNRATDGLDSLSNALCGAPFLSQSLPALPTPAGGGAEAGAVHWTRRLRGGKSESRPEPQGFLMEGRLQ